MFYGHDKPPSEGFRNQECRCNYITICYLEVAFKIGTLKLAYLQNSAGS
jgi:hypothetical protein